MLSISNFKTILDTITKLLLAKLNATNINNNSCNRYSNLTHNVIGHLRSSLADGYVTVLSLIS